MKIHLRDALVIMGIYDERFHNLLRSPSFEIALERLEDMKREVRRQRRILAKKFHPDIAGEEGLERMKEINNIAEMLLKLQIQRQPPPQQLYRTVFYMNITPNAWSTGNDSASTTSSAYTTINFRF